MRIYSISKINFFLLISFNIKSCAIVLFNTIEENKYIWSFYYFFFQYILTIHLFATIKKQLFNRLIFFNYFMNIVFFNFFWKYKIQNHEIQKIILKIQFSVVSLIPLHINYEVFINIQKFFFCLFSSFLFLF